MPLMPADVANVAFSKPPLGKRGYDEDEVDAFLDLVEAELARLIEENVDLLDRVESLEHQQLLAPVDTGGDLSPAKSLGPPLPPPLRGQTSAGGDYNVHAARVLGLAQEMADRLTGEAKAEADRMLGDARTKSEQLLSEARAKAEGMVNEARTRSETMLNDARTKAETLERQSRDKVASWERDTARQHTEIIAGLCQEKDILENKIDELRTFERGYRTRLKIYLDAQLRELGGRGSAAPADPMRTQQGLVGSGLGAHAEAGSR
ncbi:MAG: cell division initiation protein [Pseudonocardiales bacterium]|nr:MAG: cell division initiation protein [Pseudonocardiales bacterium]